MKRIYGVLMSSLLIAWAANGEERSTKYLSHKDLNISIELFRLLTETPSMTWDYSGSNGPNFWWRLSKDHTCGLGLNQSPIAIKTEFSSGLQNILEDQNLKPIKFSWKPSKLYLFKNGHTLETIYDVGNTIEWNNATYSLEQFHFHAPSEHIIDEKQAPMEAHFVHYSQQVTGLKILVVSVMLQIGLKNPAMQLILDHAPTIITKAPKRLTNDTINALDLLPAKREYFAYVGSLTTPPCTEGVQWIIMQNPVFVSIEQVRQFQVILKGDNNRPIQSLNQRVVKSSHFIQQYIESDQNLEKKIESSINSN